MSAKKENYGTKTILPQYRGGNLEPVINYIKYQPEPKRTCQALDIF